MSATTRQSIAAAVDTVTDLHGFAERPKAPAVGDSWPLVAAIDRGPGDAFQTTWRVVVVLAPEEVAAIDMFDEVLPQTVEALKSELYVDSARPITIPTEAGKLFGLEITGRSE